MTRESRARWLALATAALVVLMSALFAMLRNVTPLQPTARQAAPVAVPAPPAARLAAGRAAFDRLNCAMCHSIEGRGNPSHPLDGVGARRGRDALRDWSFGSGAAAGALPTGIARTKARSEQDPDVEALLDFLQHLR